MKVTRPEISAYLKRADFKIRIKAQIHIYLLINEKRDLLNGSLEICFGKSALYVQSIYRNTILSCIELKKKTWKSDMSNSIYRKIMVATDGSDHVRKAIATAIEVAKLSGAKLYAVYVIANDEFSMPAPKNVELEKAFVNYLRNEGKEAIAYVETSGKDENVEVESVILEGSPAHEIVHFAERNDIDLIVMGTHGKNAIERFLLGSIAENVVRHSKKAVLVVREKNIGTGK